MSNPIPVTVVGDARPVEVVVISHSPLYYWWPVWAVGFLMAGLSYWFGYQVAFVPPGTTAHKGPPDVLIAPEGAKLPTAHDSDELLQPRMRMAVSSDLGIIWAMTLLIVIYVTHIQMRGVWSLVALILLISLTVVFAVLGLWEPIVRAVRVLDIHMNAFGYLSISLVLFAIVLLMFLVFVRLTYMVFTRGRLRVRKKIGEGEKVFDMRGMVFERHRDDMFRHWLLGFGTADLTVYTTGATSQQIEMPNVIGVGRKLALI